MLELACGTGALLAQLRDRYEVAGVDLSPAMLELARAKLPDVDLALGDMASARLGRRFDAVVCVYDSINHLLRFEDWERTFDTARAHLDEGGAFLLDVNLEEKLRRLAEHGPIAQPLADGTTLTIDVTLRGGVFEWRLEREGVVEVIPEAAFPPDRIRAALAARFKDVHEHPAPDRTYFAAVGPVRPGATRS